MIQCQAGPKTLPDSFSKSKKCNCHLSSHREDHPCKFWSFASKACFDGFNGGKWYPCGEKKRQLGNLAKVIDLHKLSIVDEHLHFILQYCHIHLHVVCTCMSYGALACHMHLHVFCTDLMRETFCQSVVRQGFRLGNRAELGFISSSCRVFQKIAYGILRSRLGN